MKTEDPLTTAGRLDNKRSGTIYESISPLYICMLPVGSWVGSFNTVCCRWAVVHSGQLSRWAVVAGGQLSTVGSCRQWAVVHGGQLSPVGSCPVGQLSGGEMSGGQLSGGEMSAHLRFNLY